MPLCMCPSFAMLMINESRGKADASEIASPIVPAMASAPDQVNDSLTAASKKLQEARLKAFVQARAT